MPSTRTLRPVWPVTLTTIGPGAIVATWSVSSTSPERVTTDTRIRECVGLVLAFTLEGYGSAARSSVGAGPDGCTTGAGPGSAHCAACLGETEGELGEPAPLPRLAQVGQEGGRRPGGVVETCDDLVPRDPGLVEEEGDLAGEASQEVEEGGLTLDVGGSSTGARGAGRPPRARPGACGSGVLISGPLSPGCSVAAVMAGAGRRSLDSPAPGAWCRSSARGRRRGTRGRSPASSSRLAV